MNEFLAEIYNTRETIGASSGSSDVEKLAEAQLLDSALKNEGIDVNTLSGDQIVKVAHHLFGDNSEIVKMAQEEGHEGSETTAEEAKEEAAKEGEGETQEEKAEGEEEPEKQSMAEKIAEADLLGRVMAHSFVNEQSQIEKDAGRIGDAGKWVAGKARSALEGAKKAPEAVKAAPGKAKKWASEPVRTFKARRKGYEKLIGDKQGFGKLHGGSEGRVRAGLETLTKHPGQAGTAAGLLAAVGGGGAYAATRGKKKAASALDVLAEQRALEILKEAGVVQQTEEEKLAEAVEQRAYEMLQEHGYLNEGEGE